VSDTASTAKTGRTAGAAGRVVVAALGNEYRRDDAAGPAAVSMVVQQCPGVTMVGPLDDPFDLLGLWDGALLAVVVDAVSSGSPPGTVQVVELDPTAPVPARERGASGTNSTHGIGLAGIYRLARAIERAPSRLVAVGIEGSDFAQGVGLSDGVEEGVEHAARHVVEMIREVG
jgi:hydrogenase maturation protease